MLGVIFDQVGWFSIVRFTRERIEITVRPDHFDVDGIYIYENPLPVPWTRGLSIPFFISPTQSAPATVLVTELGTEETGEEHELSVRWLRDKPYFSITVPARGSTRIRVRFTQYSPAGTGTYLLTTTQPWCRPLDHGDYILQPQGVEVVGSSYALDNADRLSFSRNRFMPQKDWTFSWTSEEKP